MLRIGGVVKTLTIWSDGIYRIFGFDPKEFTATHQTFLDHVHPDDRHAVDDAYSASLRDNSEGYDIVHRIVRHDTGEVRYVHERCEHVRNASGVAIRSIGMCQDITDRVTSQQALEEERERLREAQAIAHVGSWDYDSLRNKLVWSEETHRIFGTTRGLFEETYEAFLETVHPADLPEVVALYARSLEDAEVTYEIEHRMIRRDNGEERRVYEKCRHHRDGEGRVLRSTGVVHDITDIRQKEAELKAAEESLRLLNQELEERVRRRTRELEEANKQLEAFSYSVSHDLRAPLRGVTGLTRILLDKHAAGLPEDGKKLCAMISDNARTMGLLIDDLLTFSRAGRKALQVSSIDMTALVHAVIEELRTTEDTVRVNFQVQDLPPAEADPGLLRQVWQNLLANAVKFSSITEHPVIQVSAKRQEDGRVVYHVQDNGAGFDIKLVDKIFRVFKRLHSSREFEGTGVGLAIVQQIVNRHGGRVWAQGEPGKGATFSFTLGGGQNE